MPKKEQKRIRDKFINLSFSKNEMEEIDKFTKESNYSTRSGFIRQAIFDKINRIQNPELFMTKTTNNGKIEVFLEEVRSNTKQQEKILKKLTILNEIQQTLGTLQAITKRPIDDTNEKMVIKLLKEYNHLKPLKIIELTKLGNHEVYDVIRNKLLFKINLNGKVELI